MSEKSRYNHPSSNKGQTAGKMEDGAEAAAKKTAGSPPSDSKPGDAFDKKDKGPLEGRDSTWGEVAKHHHSERASMDKRHSEIADALHGKHMEDHKDMSKRHAKDGKGGDEHARDRMDMHAKHDADRHAMHGQHHQEHTAMAMRQSREIGEEEAPEPEEKAGMDKMEKTVGKPKELGGEKSEGGDKGKEP